MVQEVILLAACMMERRSRPLQQHTRGSPKDARNEPGLAPSGMLAHECSHTRPGLVASHADDKGDVQPAVGVRLFSAQVGDDVVHDVQRVDALLHGLALRDGFLCPP